MKFVLGKWHWNRSYLNKFQSLLDFKEIQPIGPKGNQPWIVIGRTDSELKLQYFGHLMWRANSLENTRILQKNEGRRRRGQQRMRWLDGITNSMDVSFSRLWKIATGKPGVLQSMGSQRIGHDWATEMNWTELKGLLDYVVICSWTSFLKWYNTNTYFIVVIITKW